MATNPPLPVIVLLIVIVGGWLVGMVFFVLRDRKWSMRRGVSDGTDGRFAATIPVPIPTHLGAVAMVRIATLAVKEVGGPSVTKTPDGAVIGWVGSPFVNIPRWGEYQVVVVTSRETDGSALFLCRCRPRNPLSFLGPGISEEIAQRLAAQVAAQVRLGQSHEPS